MARNRQPFRPYRLTPRASKTDRYESSLPCITPFDPPEYLPGDIVYCHDKTNRAITHVVARRRVWVYHWVLVTGMGEGVTMESALKRQDSMRRR